jgi:hypothetical protein
VLPFIRGSRNPRRLVFRTGHFRGVVQLARVKGRYVPPRRPDRIRKNSKGERKHMTETIVCGGRQRMGTARVCQLARGREVVGIAACVAKLISAERQKALHILAAADRALAELQG